MDFEWDEDKRQSNLRKHDLDFADAKHVYRGPTIESLDDRYKYDEERFIVTGFLDGELIVFVYTERGNSSRIISMRKADRYERQQFFQAVWG